MSTRKQVRRVGLLPALAMIAGCAGAGANYSDPFDEPVNESVRLYVENDNFYGARISTILDGVRRQIGFVDGKQRGVFEFPLRFSQDLRVQIDLLAGPTCTTESIPVDPGDELRLQIMNDDGTGFCRG